MKLRSVLDVDVLKCAVSGVEIQGFDNLADKAAVEDGLVGELNSQLICPLHCLQSNLG